MFPFSRAVHLTAWESVARMALQNGVDWGVAGWLLPPQSQPAQHQGRTQPVAPTWPFLLQDEQTSLPQPVTCIRQPVYFDLIVLAVFRNFAAVRAFLQHLFLFNYQFKLTSPERQDAFQMVGLKGEWYLVWFSRHSGPPSSAVQPGSVASSPQQLTEIPTWTVKALAPCKGYP